MTMTCPLLINEVINNKELCEIFLCAPQGGMRKSNRTNTLTLISDKLSYMMIKLLMKYTITPVWARMVNRR
ncbi:hypothetical protein [Lysinibacillus sphaericus]|uniref:hypothetical protein n=1 Tax=Lysinibacillus sphaericus TaxID=1421 RepID=UPI003D70918E